MVGMADHQLHRQLMKSDQNWPTENRGGITTLAPARKDERRPHMRRCTWESGITR